MDQQTIQACLKCAARLATTEDSALEGYLPVLVDTEIPLSVADLVGISGDEERTRAVFQGQMISWREFNGTELDFALLSESWEILAAELSQHPPIADSNYDGPTVAELDLLSRTLVALNAEAAKRNILLVDSGPLQFRWAAAIIGLQFFDLVLLSTLGPRSLYVPFRPSTRPRGKAGSSNGVSTNKYVALTKSMDSARLARQFTGVPAISVDSVHRLAASHRHSRPLLTIVIPALSASSLSETLSSVVEQSASYQVEVLIMMASSTRTKESGISITDEELDGPSIVNIAVADRAPYEAMNTALHIANSEWVYFMGAGDTLASDRILETVFSALEAVPKDCGMVYGNVRMIGDGPGAKDGEIYAGEFDYDRLRQQNICHQSIFYRLSAVKELGGFDTIYPVNADWAMNIKGWLSLKPQFVDLLVANFVRGGLSTTKWDSRFFQDLDRLWGAQQEHPR